MSPAALRCCKLYNNNSYQLLLYFATRFITVVFEWVTFAAILTVIGFIAKWKTLNKGIFISLGAGIFFSACQEVRGVLVQLINYDESVSKLGKQLLDSQQPATVTDKQLGK